jgi:hypothetical protein
MTQLVPHETALPAELIEQTAADSGRGVSTRPEDQLIPIVYVLQTNSPACDKRGAGYIEDAEPGHFLLRGAIEPIRDGTVGIDVIPCGMTHSFLEWLENRQGLIGRHAKPPSDIEVRTIKGEGGRERASLVRSNGNLIVDTREFFLLIEGAPYMLPCYGTRHTFAKTWQSRFQQYKHPRTGAVLPSFARRYRLRTVATSNALGHWYGLQFTDEGWVSVAEYQLARALNDVVERGAQRVELPINESAPIEPARVADTTSRQAPGVA